MLQIRKKTERKIALPYKQLTLLSLLTLLTLFTLLNLLAMFTLLYCFISFGVEDK